MIRSYTCVCSTLSCRCKLLDPFVLTSKARYLYMFCYVQLYRDVVQVVLVSSIELYIGRLTT